MNNYSGSKCPKCELTNFEMVQETPTHSAFNIWFIRCTDCKIVVGATDFTQPEYLIRKLAQKLGLNLDLED